MLLALDEYLDRPVRPQPLGQALPAPGAARLEYGADQNPAADGLRQHPGSPALQGLPVVVLQILTEIVVGQHDTQFPGLPHAHVKRLPRTARKGSTATSPKVVTETVVSIRRRCAVCGAISCMSQKAASP